MKQAMEVIKHKSIPVEATIELGHVVGKKVLTSDGENIGKVKEIHLHPKKLTVEGIHVDTGLFDVDQYIDKNYIAMINNEGAVLKIVPVVDYVGLRVIDAEGREIGKVRKINRSRKSNKLLSFGVKLDEKPYDIDIAAHYIKSVGEVVMLNEPWKEDELIEAA